MRLRGRRSFSHAEGGDTKRFGGGVKLTQELEGLAIEKGGGAVQKVSTL